MRTIFLGALLVVWCVGAVSGQDSAATAPAGLTWADEILIVRAILDSNGMRDVSTDDICKEENGRMVSLNLTNKAGKSGMTKLPSSIGKLTALRELRLANNSLSGLPEEIGNLVDLKVLDLASNQIATFPASMTRLANIEKLDLRYNGLTQLPDIVLSFKKLWYLQLWGNQMTALPEGLAALANLKEIYLKDNRLDMLPHSITRIKSLTYIDYNYNRICKPTPDVDAWLKARDKKYLETQKCW